MVSGLEQESFDQPSWSLIEPNAVMRPYVPWTFMATPCPLEVIRHGQQDQAKRVNLPSRVQRSPSAQAPESPVSSPMALILEKRSTRKSIRLRTLAERCSCCG